jgi:hypothetical protein
MPSHNQNTVDTPEGGNGKLGAVKELSRSNTESLKNSFPGSPIHNGLMTRANVQTSFQELVLDGVVADGYCFSKFDRDYTGAPKISTEVKGAPSGGPGSSHMPNPLSPGAGSVNPADQQAPPEDLQKSKTSRPPFIGPGTALDPSGSSIIQSQHRVKNYIMGKSSALSVGSHTSKP